MNKELESKLKLKLKIDAFDEDYNQIFIGMLN